MINKRESQKAENTDTADSGGVERNDSEIDVNDEEEKGDTERIKNQIFWWSLRKTAAESALLVQGFNLIKIYYLI